MLVGQMRIFKTWNLHTTSFLQSSESEIKSKISDCWGVLSFGPRQIKLSTFVSGNQGLSG